MRLEPNCRILDELSRKAGYVFVLFPDEPSRHQEMRDFRGKSYARDATNKTPPNMSVSAK